MSTRVSACEQNVHFTTRNHLQCYFREFGSTFNWPHNCIHVSPRQPRTSTFSFLAATQTTDAIVGLQKQRISAQTPRNHPREGHLYCRLHQGLYLTAARNNISGQVLTLDGMCHFGEVFSSWMTPSLHCTRW